MKRTHDTLVHEQDPGGLQLTPAQEEAFKAITCLRNSECLFLTGEAGAGKSVVAHAAIKRILQSTGPGAFIVAGSTGIAALEIGGATLDRHMGWKINGDTADTAWLESFAEDVATAKRAEKFNNKEQTLEEKRKASLVWVKEALQRAKGMLVDEVSMLLARKLDNMDFVLRRVRGFPNKPFGGLKLIFVGDFFQLPPVPNKDMALYDPEYHFAFQARVWKEAKVRMLYLPGSQRQKDDVAYAGLLSRARLGRLSEEDKVALQARVLPPPMEEDIEAAYLFPHNREADAKNSECLKALSTSLRTFEATDTFTNAFLRDDVFRDVRAIKTIALKAGAYVMLLTNMTRLDLAAVNVALPEDAGSSDPLAAREKQKEIILANGSTGRVTRFARLPGGDDDEYPIVRFVRKHGKGVIEVPIRTHKFDVPGTNPRLGPIASRLQLPLLLCYAISAHKSQGQTIEAPIVPDLVHCFQDGMGYVMLSRVKSRGQLYLPNFDAAVFKADPRVLAFHQQEGYALPQV
jgi:ATP-dependent DNA helicase PIF1